MGKTISASAVNRVSRALGVDKSTTLPILASLSREGADIALQRFPDHRGRILREATILRERNLLDVPDLDGQRFETSGYWWTVTPPSGFEDFKAIAHDKGSTRTHLRVTFTANDMASGWNNAEDFHIKSKKPHDIERDPVLRMAIARAIRSAACAYLEKLLRDRTGVTGYFRRHLSAVCDNVFSLQHLIPNMSLQIRKAPHLQGEEADKMIVSASYAGVFEMTMNGRGSGEIFEGVNIQHNPSLFEIAGAVDTIEDGLKDIDGIEGDTLRSIATSLRTRRKTEKKVVMEGPPEALHIETLDPEGPDTSIDVKGPGTNMEILEAGIKEDAGAAIAWWKSHKGLIKPSISELATTAMSNFGDGVSKTDIPVLVDITFPSLQKVAKSRQTQFVEFGFDAAVVGLGRMLQNELKQRLR